MSVFRHHSRLRWFGAVGIPADDGKMSEKASKSAMSHLARGLQESRQEANMSKHTHRVADLTVRPFCGAIASAPQNQNAHGNITVHDRCRCGATRQTNVNQRHVERGRWSSDDRED